MTADVIVIGGGFWGVAVANEAVNRGRSVLMIDDGNKEGGSRAASGLAHLSWMDKFPYWWGPQHTRQALSWLADKMGARHTGEWFSSYSRPQMKWRKGLYVVDDIRVATNHDWRVNKLKGIAVAVEQMSFGWRVHGRFGRADAEAVVIAAGVWTDKLLTNSGFNPVGVSSVAGRSLILRSAEKLDHLPRTFLARPYTHYTLRPWPNGLLHLGATTERTVQAGLTAFSEMCACAKMMAPGSTIVDTLHGRRPVCEYGKVEALAHRFVIATGGGKIGLTMAKPVADRVMRLIA